jgi:ribosome biogenesis SPOUT family RNA methylase Rps3
MTQMEALELALRLAIAAPDQKHVDQAVLLAEEIAAGMTLEEIATVEEELEFERRSQ